MLAQQCDLILRHQRNVDALRNVHRPDRIKARLNKRTVAVAGSGEFKLGFGAFGHLERERQQIHGGAGISLRIVVPDARGRAILETHHAP